MLSTTPKSSAVAFVVVEALTWSERRIGCIILRFNWNKKRTATETATLWFVFTAFISGIETAMTLCQYVVLLLLLPNREDNLIVLELRLFLSLKAKESSTIAAVVAI